MERALANLDQLPKTTLETPEELSQLVDIIIDGVETPCVRPQHEARQKEYYSGKKTPDREIAGDFHQRRLLFVSPLFGGSIHDYGMLTDLFDPDLPWFENLTVRLDLGLLGIEKDYGASSTILIPHEKPSTSKQHPFPKLTSDQKQDHRKLAKVRILVEHAIAGMKHFHCLTHRIRNQSISLINQFFALSAGL